MLRCSVIMMNAVRFKILVKRRISRCGCYCPEKPPRLFVCQHRPFYEAWILFSVAGSNVQLGESLGV